MSDPLAQPVKVPRGEWDKPLVIPVGGKPGDPLKAYRRVTTYIKPMKDTYNIERWGNRCQLLGAIAAPHLVGKAVPYQSNTKEDKEKLNKIVDELKAVGKAHAASDTGTALHKVIEKKLRAEPLGVVPEAFRNDLEAYLRAVDCLTVLESERFLVHDELQCGGTPDLIVELNGRFYIADIKTGSIDYPGEMAMQLAIYARSQFYDPVTGIRTPLPPVSQTNGIIIHLPAGTGTCELIWLNIGETGDPEKPGGWDGVKALPFIYAYRRNEKRLTKPFMQVSA